MQEPTTTHAVRPASHFFGSLLASGILIGASLMLGMPTAQADDSVVYSPYVIPGQTEFEFRGSGLRDGNATLDGKRAYQFAIGHAFTDWWRPEIYFGRYGRDPGAGTQFKGYEFENIFQLAPAGEYWADPGFLFAYDYNTQAGKPNAMEFGPLFEKRVGRFVHRINLIWEKQVGGSAAANYEFRTGYSLSYQWYRSFAPGVEIYALPHEHAYRIGPVFYGEQVFPGSASEFEYSAGVLAGLNPSTPDLTFVLRLEYEFF